MEVILLERIEKLGHMGDTVKVKPGFARNYLLPQKKALRATKENQARFEAQRAVSEITAVTQPRPGKKHGMIHFSTETINQKDEVAMSMRSSCPVPLRTDGNR